MALRQQSLITQAEPRPCPDELRTAAPQIPGRRRPSGRVVPHLGSAMASMASLVIVPPPKPADCAFLSREALRPAPGRTLLATMVAVKVARGLHHDLVGPTDGQGWLGLCPGRLLSKTPHHYRRRGRRIVNVNGRGWAKNSTF